MPINLCRSNKQLKTSIMLSVRWICTNLNSLRTPTVSSRGRSTVYMPHYASCSSVCPVPGRLGSWRRETKIGANVSQSRSKRCANFQFYLVKNQVPLFAWTGTTVPRRSRHSSHRSCIATSATFRQPTPAHCASLSTQHIRSSSFSGCWSDGLELTARWTQRSGVWCRQLQTVI